MLSSSISPRSSPQSGYSSHSEMTLIALRVAIIVPIVVPPSLEEMTTFMRLALIQFLFWDPRNSADNRNNAVALDKATNDRLIAKVSDTVECTSWKKQQHLTPRIPYAFVWNPPHPSPTWLSVIILVITLSGSSPTFVSSYQSPPPTCLWSVGVSQAFLIWMSLNCLKSPFPAPAMAYLPPIVAFVTTTLVPSSFWIASRFMQLSSFSISSSPPDKGLLNPEDPTRHGSPSSPQFATRYFLHVHLTHYFYQATRSGTLSLSS